MGSIPTRSRHPGRARSASPKPVAGGSARRRRGEARAFLPARLPILLPVFLLWATPVALGAQQPDTTARRAGVPAADTTPLPVADSARADSAGSHRIAPLGALARSLVMPGWGQASVGRPVRGAFYFAAEAGSLFMVIKSQQKLAAARRALAAGRADSSLVESRVSQREDWIVLSVFWAVLSGVDAWVSANLSDFQHPLTPPPDGTPGAALQIRVPVGGPP